VQPEIKPTKRKQHKSDATLPTLEVQHFSKYFDSRKRKKRKVINAKENFNTLAPSFDKTDLNTTPSNTPLPPPRSNNPVSFPPVETTKLFVANYPSTFTMKKTDYCADEGRPVVLSPLPGVRRRSGFSATSPPSCP